MKNDRQPPFRCSENMVTRGFGTLNQINVFSSMQWIFQPSQCYLDTLTLKMATKCHEHGRQNTLSMVFANGKLSGATRMRKLSFEPQGLHHEVITCILTWTEIHVTLSRFVRVIPWFHGWFHMSCMKWVLWATICTPPLNYKLQLAIQPTAAALTENSSCASTGSIQFW